MKPQITIITLGVSNLEKALVFYRDGLGLETEGIVGTEFEYGAVAFFKLKNGLQLALYPKASLAKDANVSVNDMGTLSFSIGHNVMNKDEVNKIMEKAKNAGARITKSAQDTFWGGYAGYFQDLDNHLWEIAWNPQMLPE
jgi:uncharacterized glyoxalase superfamily protein PhnB